MARIHTISMYGVRALYEDRQPNGHWFDHDTMRFFKTKLPGVAYVTSVGILFITSEVNPSGIKRYSIRRQEADGDINTVGEFHSYITHASALAEVKRLHKESGHA